MPAGSRPWERAPFRTYSRPHGAHFSGIRKIINNYMACQVVFRARKMNQDNRGKVLFHLDCPRNSSDKAICE